LRTVLAAITSVLLGGCNCGAGGPQAQPCKDYIACFERTGGAKGSIDPSYGPTGTCWITPMDAASCAANCTIALNVARTSYPDAGC